MRHRNFPFIFPTLHPTDHPLQQIPSRTLIKIRDEIRFSEMYTRYLESALIPPICLLSIIHYPFSDRYLICLPSGSFHLNRHSARLGIFPFFLSPAFPTVWNLDSIRVVFRLFQFVSSFFESGGVACMEWSRRCLRVNF